MPVFNDKKFLKRALDSLLVQTHRDFELIISDDGSTDGSEEICKEYVHADPRIQYIRQAQNMGISKNMEFLLSKARGKYFMWAANDDVWHPEFIETLKKGLQHHPDAAMAFGPMIYIDENDKELQKPKVNRIDYSGKTAISRLFKLINLFDDACGYGLFVKEKIKAVQFPVWWGINKTRAYNNIYPPLCFFLSKGDYVFCGDRPLWFNRLKDYGNHTVPYPETFMRGLAAFNLWKFNMVVESARQIGRGSNVLTALFMFPFLFLQWFLIPSCKGFAERIGLLVRGEIKFW